MATDKRKYTSQEPFEALVGSPNDSRLSDISFPSHVSGLESFMDFDETLENVDHNKHDHNSQLGDVESELEAKSSLSAFLKISSPPGSTSNSVSLNDSSSMSLTKLEALQGQMKDSFLNSHSDDSEHEKNMQEFLHDALSSEKVVGKNKPSLSDMIEQSKTEQHVTDEQGTVNVAATPDQPGLKLNQTELDSLFLKEVRNRLQLSSLESTMVQSVPDDIDKTLLEIENAKANDKEARNLQDDIGQRLSMEIQKVGEEFDRSNFGQVERPNLDGSSSDSDTDMPTTTTSGESNFARTTTSGASNFARTAIQTACYNNNNRFNIQQELQDLNLQNIPERQLAEGIDNVSPSFGDGGGGGDGSSGHSDSDMGGDGGVAIRNVRFSPAVGSENDGSGDDVKGRTTPPSRERPVGGSGPSDVVSSNSSRQVHFSNTPKHPSDVTMDTKTPTNNIDLQEDTEVTPQESRLSARYFLAASTPFKAGEGADQSENATTRNWMNQSSFQVPSSSLHQSMNERTLVGAGEITMATSSFMNIHTPTSMTLSRLRHEHGDDDWTLTSIQNGDASLGKSAVNQMASENPSMSFSNNNAASSGIRSQPYNPFETFNGGEKDGTLVSNFMGFDDGANNYLCDEQFSTDNKNLEEMFNEDERIVAMNNNTMFKENDETGVSEWSIRTQNHQINSLVMPSELSNDPDSGRVSTYFQSKSKELGKLSGDGTVRPKFSDDSGEVITPPAALPMPLVKEGSNCEHEKTIPMEVFSSPINNKTFTPAPATVSAKNQSKDINIETPKSALLKTHKRNSSTVLQKKQKRQILGEDTTTISQLHGKQQQQQQHQQQQHRNDKTLSIQDIGNKPTVSVPSSELEASALLNDIRERRVSAIGLDKQQVSNMAKLIATMTGTDESLVYQLICMLPKNKNSGSLNDNQNQSGNHASVSGTTGCNTCFSSVDNISDSLATVTAPCQSDGKSSSNYSSVGYIHKVTPYNNNIGGYKNEGDGRYTNEGGRKPISSVIPINAERPESFVHRTTVSGENVPPVVTTNQNRQDFPPGTRIPERYSDPQPIFDRLHTDQRLAVSVSPVRSNLHRRNIQDVHSIENRLMDNMSSFQPRNLTNFGSYDVSNSQFIPLTNQSQMSGYNSTTDNVFFQNPLQTADDDRGSTGILSRFSNQQQNSHTTISSFGSVSDQDSIIHSDSLVYPKDINFEVCCVGASSNKIIQLKNSNRCWLQCQIHTAFFAFNGTQMDPRSSEVFLLPPKVTIEPESTEEIKIRFQPDRSGTYMLKLEFLVTSLIRDETNLRWQRLPNVMNIGGVAETPNIELIFNENKYLDFGEMTYGSCRKQELKLLNKGRADVPVHLQILSNADGRSGDPDLFQICLNDSGTDCGTTNFKNKNNNSANISIQDNTTKATSTTFVVPGHKQSGIAMKPKHITLLFQAPKTREKELENIMSPPSEYTKRLLVETNTKNAMHVGNVFMKAVVGYSRLLSLKTMQAISFNTVVGQKVSRIIPLHNSGNITLHLQPKIIGATNYFSIFPDSLSIKPGGESEVRVTFTSTHSVVAESRLFVTLLPDGDQYEWCLRGTCTSVPAPLEEKPVLFCNKLFLNWCGVAIGQSKQQKLVLRNSSDYKTVQLSVSIHNDHPNFQVQSSPMLEQKGLNRFSAVLTPQSELPVYVAMKPTCFASVNASLVLRVVNGTTKYVIPLNGYGGCGTLDIHGAKKINDQFVIEMGQTYLGKKSNINIMLRNSGSRASFVCMKCFSDVTSKTEYPSTHVTISPNNFVLSEKTSCQITISYTPLREHALKNETFTAAHLAIYSGDEVLRKEFRRYHEKMKYNRPHASNTLNILPITSDFMNETTIDETVTFNSIPDWENFFLSGMNRNIIQLVSNTLPAEKLKKNSSDFKIDLVPVYPNTKQQQFIKSAQELWTITPQKLILDMNETSSSTYKLKLINYSKIDLPFVIDQSDNVFVVTPSVDKVSALGEIGIRVDVKPTFVAKMRENVAGWDGYLSVQCNGDKKVVQVHLKGNSTPINTKPTKGETSPPAEVQTKHSQQRKSSARMEQPEEQNDLKNESWSVSQRHIVLNATSTGNSPDYKLYLTNNTNQELPFEFIWPAESLVITPSKDKIPANSHLGIRVDAKHSCVSRHEDDSWSGSIYIQCDGKQKSVSVQVRKSSSEKEQRTKSPETLTTTTTHDLSLEPHQHISHSMKDCLIVTPQVLEFNDTAVKQNADSSFTIKNMSDVTGDWTLLSICPSYFKSLNGENSTISRVSYPVFKFAKQSGKIHGHQSIKLPVSFHPTDHGLYSQFWDLEMKHEGSTLSSKIRLELIGKGKYKDEKENIEIQVGNNTNVPKASVERNQASTEVKQTSNNTVSPPISNRSGHVFVKDDVLNFNPTKVGSTTELKFRLCNDSNEIQKVRVSGFRSPFSVILKHMRLSIRPKSYIRVPVYYTPCTPETMSEGLLVLTPENGENLCVKLSGTSL